MAEEITTVSVPVTEDESKESSDKANTANTTYATDQTTALPELNVNVAITQRFMIGGLPRTDADYEDLTTSGIRCVVAIGQAHDIERTPASFDALSGAIWGMVTDGGAETTTRTSLTVADLLNATYAVEKGARGVPRTLIAEPGPARVYAPVVAAYFIAAFSGLPFAHVWESYILTACPNAVVTPAQRAVIDGALEHLGRLSATAAN